MFGGFQLMGLISKETALTKRAAGVKRHTRQDCENVLQGNESVIRGPQNPGVQLHHIMTVNLSAGTIDHVVNGVDDPADTTKIGVPVYIVDYRDSPLTSV